MNERGDITGTGVRLETTDEAVEALLGKAKPRPLPPREDEAMIRSVVHSEWRQMTAQRNRRRRLVSLGIAASVMIALFAGLSMLRSPGDAVRPEQVATIERQFGAIRVYALDSVEQDASPLLFSGQTVETGAAAGIALAWDRGGSLRIDRDSRVLMESRSRIRLLQGRIYFDSVTDPLTRTATVAGQARLSVNTPYGTVRHVGTQFAAELLDEELILSVREGVVRLESDGVRETATAGQQVQVHRDRSIELASINGSDVYWQWAAELAPPVSLEGRSVEDALHWISRESGLDIRFADAATERAAREAEIRGLDDLGRADPSRALRAILPITGFAYREEGSVIIVGLAQTDEETI